MFFCSFYVCLLFAFPKLTIVWALLMHCFFFFFLLSSFFFLLSSLIGAELIRLISDHPQMTLKVASSRALEGEKVSTIISKQQIYGGASSWDSVASSCGGLDPELKFVNLGPEEAASKHSEDIDLWFLALPNGLAQPFVHALVDQDTPSQSKKVIVDLSADHRFLCGLPDLSVSDTIDNVEEHRWVYGLPERYREDLSATTEALLVANPGTVFFFPLHATAISEGGRRRGRRRGRERVRFGST